MYGSCIDVLSRALANAHSRRAAVHLLGGGLLGLASQVVSNAEGKRRKQHRRNEAKRKSNTSAEGKKKKSTFCLNGQTVITSSKKKRKQLASSGATPGACAGRPSTCTTTAQCGAGAICVSGRCQPCSVTCSGDGAACGTALQQRLDQGGTVYVCPGRYVGRFGARAVKIIGAGSGDDPATNTILDAQGSGRTLSLAESMTVSLAQVQITGGRLDNVSGAGIYAENGDLTIDSCAIKGNVSTAPGGGLFIRGGRFQMNDSTVEQNEASSGAGMYIVGTQQAKIATSRIELNEASAGAGIWVEATELVTTRCEINRNTAEMGGGGFLVWRTTGILTLDSATRVTNNVVTRTNSTGWRGGGILSYSGGQVRLGGATLEGNTPDNVNFRT